MKNNKDKENHCSHCGQKLVEVWDACGLVCPNLLKSTSVKVKIEKLNVKEHLKLCPKKDCTICQKYIKTYKDKK